MNLLKNILFKEQKPLLFALLISFIFQISAFALDTPQQQEIKMKNQEVQLASNVINGVVAMYSTSDANLPIRSYPLKLGDYIQQVNASYSPYDQSFYLPRIVLQGNKIILTAADQGIVSHEAGHMILFYLAPQLLMTTHTGAFHEAFGDLTAHFYRYWNSNTRKKFLTGLVNGGGCIGDISDTCVRNSYQSLTLEQVLQNPNLCEVHSLSKAFSSAVYLTMSQAYVAKQPAENIVLWNLKILTETAFSLNTLQNPTLMDIALKMLDVSSLSPTYLNALGQNFINNGLITIIYKNPNYLYTTNQKFQTLCQPKQQKTLTYKTPEDTCTIL